MKINDTTSKQGITQEIDRICGTNTDDFPLVDKFRMINGWVRIVSTWIWKNDSDWKYDDSNQTTLPTAVCDLSDNDQQIQLPATTFQIERVEVLDINGNYCLVTPIDKTQISNEAMSEYLETKGLPVHYDLEGDSMILYPKVDTTMVTASEGLKIYVSREGTDFTVTATATQPGFNKNFHMIIPIGVAMDWAIPKGKDNLVVQLKRRLFGDPTVRDDKGLKANLEEYYANRNKNIKGQFIIREESMI